LKVPLSYVPREAESSKYLAHTDLFEVRSELEPVVSRWKYIGLSLRLDPAKLDTVGAAGQDLGTCLTEVLALWLKRAYDTEKFGEPSWKLLAEAVAHAVGGNNPALAQEITEKYRAHPQYPGQVTESERESLHRAKRSTASRVDSGTQPKPTKKARLSIRAPESVETESGRDSYHREKRSRDSRGDPAPQSQPKQDMPQDPATVVRGSDVIAQKTIKVTKEKQHIEWRGCGLILDIPYNSVPEGVTQFTLNIEASLSNDLKGDSIPVSAVYTFKHDLGDKKLQSPITLKMQHCASPTALDCLRIVRVNDQSNNFQVLSEGDFNSREGYGIIELHEFSRFMVILKFLGSLFLSSSTVTEYSAQIYYTQIGHLQFTYETFVIQKLDILSKVVEDSIARRTGGGYERGPTTEVQFQGNMIELEIPSVAELNGWKMDKMTSLQINKSDVDSFDKTKDVCTHAIEVWWDGEKERPDQPLRITIRLDGAKEEYNFLKVTSPTSCMQIAPTSLAKHARRERSQDPSTSSDGHTFTTPHEAAAPTVAASHNTPSTNSSSHRTGELGMTLLNRSHIRERTSIRLANGLI
jgi:hypothetical protein